MSRREAVALAETLGLQLPRIIPHTGKAGANEWHLYHGPSEGHRQRIVLPVNVDKKRLQQAIEQATEQA